MKHCSTNSKHILAYRCKKERSVAFKIRQNAFSAGTLPQTLLESSRRSPNPLVGWGGDTPFIPHPLGAFGVSILPLSAPDTGHLGLRGALPPPQYFPLQSRRPISSTLSGHSSGWHSFDVGQNDSRSRWRQGPERTRTYDTVWVEMTSQRSNGQHHRLTLSAWPKMSLVITAFTVPLSWQVLHVLTVCPLFLILQYQWLQISSFLAWQRLRKLITHSKSYQFGPN